MSTPDEPDDISCSLTNVKPESISFGLMQHWTGSTRGPCPDYRFHPGASTLWLIARETVVQIPGYEDLERYANSVLKEHLTLETIDKIRRDAAAQLGIRFEEVNRLLVREVAQALPWPSHSPATAVLCSQADLNQFFGGKGRGRGGMIEKWKAEGLIASRNKKGQKYLIVLPNPTDTERLRSFVERRRSEQKRGKARKTAE
jgi:hypothetical protein